MATPLSAYFCWLFLKSVCHNSNFVLWYHSTRNTLGIESINSNFLGMILPSLKLTTRTWHTGVGSNECRGRKASLQALCEFCGVCMRQAVKDKEGHQSINPAAIPSTCHGHWTTAHSIHSPWQMANKKPLRISRHRSVWCQIFTAIRAALKIQEGHRAGVWPCETTPPECFVFFL